MGFLVVVAVLAVGGVVALLALLPSKQVPPPSTEPEDWVPQSAPPVELPVSPMVPTNPAKDSTGVATPSFTRPRLELKPESIPVTLPEDEPKPFVFDEYEYDYTYASPDRRWQFCVVETTRYGEPLQRPRMMLVDATTGETRYTKGIKEAPEEAFVTDAGVVVLYDSGSGVDRFTALDAEGKRLWSKSFRNGVFEHMTSADHRRLVVVECENDDSVRKTSVLDAESGNRICGIDLPEDGDLVFDGNQLNIQFIGKTSVFFPVGEAGEIPEEFWDAVGEEYGFARFIEPKIDAALSKSPPRKKEALRLLDQLEKKGNIEDRAMALSFRGDIALDEGQEQQALTYWEEALALDPRSVKRGRVRDLRRKLNRESQSPSKT